MGISEEYKKFLNWCEGKWTQEHKMQKLLSKLSNDDIDFLKEQYETRLKADLVAMLTEIQLEIEELDSSAGYDGNGMPTFSTDYIRKKKVNELIQKKINALKENEDGND